MAYLFTSNWPVLNHKATKLQGRLGNVFILGGCFPAKDSISMKEKMGIGGQLAAADIIATPLDL